MPRLLMALLVGAAWCHVPAQAQSPAQVPQGAKPAPVAVPALAKPQDAEAGMIRGVTRCLNDLSMSFPITGRVAAVPVVEGSEVKPGTVLAHLDRAAELLDVQRRKLQWQSQAEIQAAAARRQTLAKQAESARMIFKETQGISREELENKELAYSLAVAEHERLKNAKNMERLDYLTAAENLERRTLRSPSRGIVTKIIKQVGEGVQANEPAIRVCDLSKVLFTANVPAAQVGDLAARDTVELLVGPAPIKVQGRVLFVSPVLDAASGLREVKVELLPTTQDVRPGMAAKLNVLKVVKAR